MNVRSFFHHFHWQCLGIITLALLLTGCSTILAPGKPARHLRLNPSLPAALPEQTLPIKQQLVVSMPEASFEIDTDRIALLFHERELRYLANARWTNKFPSVLQGAILSTFESTLPFATISSDKAGVISDIKLQTDLKQFTLHYADEKSIPTAVFQATFVLIDVDKGSIIASLPLYLREQAASTKEEALIAAYETVLNKGLGELYKWVYATILAHQRSGTNKK